MTQVSHSNEAEVRSLAFDGQRVDLFRELKANKKLFTRLEYGKTVMAITNLSREQYPLVKTKLLAEIEKRKQQGVDHSKTYKI